MSWATLNNYVIQNGDHLYWRQYNSNSVGGLNLTGAKGSSTFDLSSGTDDTAGVPVAGMSQQGEWVNREVDLSSFAGYKINGGSFAGYGLNQTLCDNVSSSNIKTFFKATYWGCR